MPNLKSFTFLFVGWLVVVVFFFFFFFLRGGGCDSISPPYEDLSSKCTVLKVDSL